MKILQPPASIKQTEPQRCTITPARGYFQLAPYKVGGGGFLLLNQRRHGRDAELCFDQSFKCRSSILSDAGVKCTVVQVKGVDAPFAAFAFAPMVPGLVYTYGGGGIFNDEAFCVRFGLL